MYFLDPSLDDVRSLIQVSRGSAPADLYIRGGTVCNVYSGEYLRANVAIEGRRIAYVGPSESCVGDDTHVIDASGKYLCPGYVEVHAHPWRITNPLELCRAVLPLGTTTVFCDALFFQLLMEDEVLEQCLVKMSSLPTKIFWAPRITPQTTMPDQVVKFATDRIKRILAQPNVAGIFEVTRWPLLLEGEPHSLECIATARALGKRVDGHTAGCSYEKLNPIVAAGVESCHEAIDAQQALDRLRLGMHVFLRDSSLRGDLPELIRVVTEHKVSTSRLVLTTDGPDPQYFVDKGSVEYLAQLAVEAGVDPMTALQMITLNPATYFRLDHYIGGIAPGRIADIVVNSRPDNFKPETVIADGQVVARNGRLVVDLPAVDWDQFPCDRPSLPRGARILPKHLLLRAEHAGSSFPVLDLVSSVITRRRDVSLPVLDGFVDVTQDDGLLFATLLDRHGRTATNGVLKGFARNLQGLASSCNTAGHVVVLGRSGEAMAMAANVLYEIGGGNVIVEDGRVIYQMPLESGGIMARHPFDVVVSQIRELTALLRARGYVYEDLAFTLFFLPCDFLPEIRITNMGLYDVKTRQVLRPSRKIL
ncbi:MAG: adenine deaminase [Chloroflexi bacterium]|nr:adenine deaminase [Chloroflexota bacterium]